MKAYVYLQGVPCLIYQKASRCGLQHYREHREAPYSAEKEFDTIQTFGEQLQQLKTRKWYINLF